MKIINCEQIRRMLLSCADRIIRNEPYLTTVDSAIGDGDHGIGMKNVNARIRLACGGLRPACGQHARTGRAHPHPRAVL